MIFQFPAACLVFLAPGRPNSTIKGSFAREGRMSCHEAGIVSKIRDVKLLIIVVAHTPDTAYKEFGYMEFSATWTIFGWSQTEWTFIQ